MKQIFIETLITMLIALGALMGINMGMGIKDKKIISSGYYIISAICAIFMTIFIVQLITLINL